ncbi:MAG: diguanylate cyclase domain-containing protein, partial [Anaerolineae bacterium]
LHILNSRLNSPTLTPTMLKNNTTTIRLSNLRRPIGRITISLGAATHPHHADSAKALVNAADKALLRAKRAGKNRLFVCGEALIELKPR